MMYCARVTRASPGCILYVIDQSGSMLDDIAEGISKAAFLADALNRSLMELAITCRRKEGVLDYFDVGVLAYSNSGVRSGLAGALADLHFVPISALARSPLRVETRRKKVPDGTGGIVETEVKFPVWFDPQASGGTPMYSALRTASELVSNWCREHQNSFPPMVLHISDGEPTDGSASDVEWAAAQIVAQSTNDGGAILMNLHVSASGAEPIRFPTSEEGLPNEYARMLFRASSVLPPEVRSIASEAGVRTDEGSRGYIYNGRLDEIVRFFKLGTAPTLLLGADR